MLSGPRLSMYPIRAAAAEWPPLCLHRCLRNTASMAAGDHHLLHPRICLPWCSAQLSWLVPSSSKHEFLHQARRCVQGVESYFKFIRPARTFLLTQHVHQGMLGFRRDRLEISLGYGDCLIMAHLVRNLSSSYESPDSAHDAVSFPLFGRGVSAAQSCTVKPRYKHALQANDSTSGRIIKGLNCKLGVCAAHSCNITAFSLIYTESWRLG